jgi:hypothetical protein
LKGLCFNVRQPRVAVLHAESGNWTMQFHAKTQRRRKVAMLLSAFAPSRLPLRLCVKLLLQVRVDNFKYFGGVKGFGECADGAEFLRFVKHLRAAVCGDEKNGNLRLESAQV